MFTIGMCFSLVHFHVQACFFPSKLSNKTPDEVVNDVLWEQLGKIEDVSEDFDGNKLWRMLDHDKPEGDDILDRITDMFD